MDFGEFCKEEVKAVEKILKEEAVQYDKWGHIRSKIDLSFDTLSDEFLKSVEARKSLNENFDSVDNEDQSMITGEEQPQASVP